jgi:hypothetical protein
MLPTKSCVFITRSNCANLVAMLPKISPYPPSSSQPRITTLSLGYVCKSILAKPRQVERHPSGSAMILVDVFFACTGSRKYAIFKG